MENEITQGKEINVRYTGSGVCAKLKYHKTESGDYMFYHKNYGEWLNSTHKNDNLFEEIKGAKDE